MPTLLESEAQKIAATREQQEEKLAAMVAAGKASPEDIEDVREEINTLTERLIDIYDRIEKNAPNATKPPTTRVQTGPDNAIWEETEPGSGIWVEKVPWQEAQCRRRDHQGHRSPGARGCA